MEIDHADRTRRLTEALAAVTRASTASVDAIDDAIALVAPLGDAELLGILRALRASAATLERGVVDSGPVVN